MRWAGRGAAALVRAYQVAISPLFVPRCRFYPTCSSYAVVALRRHGLVKGGGLALWRLVRCQPFHPGGVDHVPKLGSAEDRRIEQPRKGVMGVPGRRWLPGGLPSGSGASSGPGGGGAVGEDRWIQAKRGTRKVTHGLA
ncbi:MAG: membrane protein insertion efficiency factor YidD [Bifidobacteriaceae bacterium]|jgi:putative membrane protein insertion efficiency factor|nr:membrane protein insertion efficiency factor YidD [Bifidobacteriaceae bacterium]